jgi:hypothetical protein
MSAEQELGRVLDPEALDTADGPRARLVLQVPEAWARAPDGVEITIPKRFPCARCDGGGCDACGRSGALRVPDELVGGALRVPLPRRPSAAMLVRLTEPFGEGVGIDQLLVEVRLGDPATPGVWPVGTGKLRRMPRREKLLYASALLVPLAAALAALLAR